MHQRITSEVVDILNRAGFRVYKVNSNYCLDVIASRGDRKLMLRIAINIDNEKKETAEDLKMLAYTFSAIPIMVGLKYQGGMIEDETLHERFNVNAINLNTFRNILLHGRFPVAYAKRGGLYFKVDGQKLRKLRIERKMSLGNLASKLGVSRKAVYEYENYNMGATLKTILRMMEIFNEDLTMKIDIFKWNYYKEVKEIPDRSPTGRIAKRLHNKLKKIGCKAIGFKYAPIEVHAKDLEISFLTDEGLDKDYLRIKIEDVINIGKILNITPVLVTESLSGKNFDIYTIPIATIDKIESLEDLKQFIS
ncbi:MAG: helix-turn-helix domain-containing protein [Candidatus Methanomethylicia archaeon]|nr:helix-turn-helix domain-containing protein [Candidatus Methanomethylicia archaeon]